MRKGPIRRKVKTHDWQQCSDGLAHFVSFLQPTRAICGATVEPKERQASNINTRCQKCSKAISN